MKAQGMAIQHKISTKPKEEKRIAAQNESRDHVAATAWRASGGHGTRTRNPLRGT